MPRVGYSTTRREGVLKQNIYIPFVPSIILSLSSEKSLQAGPSHYRALYKLSEVFVDYNLTHGSNFTKFQFKTDFGWVSMYCCGIHQKNFSLRRISDGFRCIVAGSINAKRHSWDIIFGFFHQKCVTRIAEIGAVGDSPLNQLAMIWGAAIVSTLTPTLQTAFLKLKVSSLYRSGASI